MKKQAAKGFRYPRSSATSAVNSLKNPRMIGASADGSGIGLAGDSERREWDGVQILAEETGTSLILTNKDGRKQVIKPG